MMGRSHTLIGMATATTLISTHILPLTAPVIAAAAVGSLLPDVDTPYLTLGSKIWFISFPLYASVGHRTATHSLLAIFASTLLAVIIATSGYGYIAFALYVGYASHIAAVTDRGSGNRADHVIPIYHPAHEPHDVSLA